MSFYSDSDIGLKNDPLFNPKYEEQFLLRLPEYVAEKMHDTDIQASVEFHWHGKWYTSNPRDLLTLYLRY